MKEQYKYLAALGALVAATWIYRGAHLDVETAEPVINPVTPMILEQPEPVEALPVEQAEICLHIPVARTPACYKGFNAWLECRQLDAVADAMANPHLEEDARLFFHSQLFNTELDELVRNNMANVLVQQVPPDPNLYRAFLYMLEAKDENPVWRDYCLQFISTCVRFTAPEGREAIFKALHKYAGRPREDLSGTAVVHLVLQEQEGNVELSPEFYRNIASQVEAPDTSADARLSMLATIGKRGNPAYLPLVRKYAQQNSDPNLKRVAIGALGQMGELRDLDLAQASLSNSNRSVQMAARGALQRLNRAHYGDEQPKGKTAH